MSAYYNEIDPYAAQWLRNLIAAGHIAPGDVDERSIEDVNPDDLVGYTQCHFFAGIGVWSYALRRAGWSDDWPVWTGSCPCQPFSPIGKGLGFADPRHHWPTWFRLIAERRPDRIFGEQSANAGIWVDLVRSDLETHGYAFGSPDLPAPGFSEGAHIRQRFYWVADADNAERWADVAPRNISDWPTTGRLKSYGEFRAGSEAVRVEHAHDGRQQRGGPDHFPDATRATGEPYVRASGLLGGAGVDWLLGRDQRWRPVESGALPVVDAYPERVGLLRGYGNALDAEVATQFVAAFMDAADLRDFALSIV